MQNYFAAFKALLNDQSFRKNAVQVVVVLIAAVTGAVIVDRVDANTAVESIETTEVQS